MSTLRQGRAMSGLGPLLQPVAHGSSDRNEQKRALSEPPSAFLMLYEHTSVNVLTHARLLFPSTAHRRQYPTRRDGAGLHRESDIR